MYLLRVHRGLSVDVLCRRTLPTNRHLHATVLCRALTEMPTPTHNGTGDNQTQTNHCTAAHEHTGAHTHNRPQTDNHETMQVTYLPTMVQRRWPTGKNASAFRVKTAQAYPPPACRDLHQTRHEGSHATHLINCSSVR